MAATLDHLLWGAAALDAAVDQLEERTGVRAAPGGSHPDLGTHNAIVSLGRHRFLEVIAPDPSLPAGALVGRLAALSHPTLIMWAARVDDAAALAARAEAEGYQTTVLPGHRPRPDGRVVRWTNVFVNGHGAGVMVPFFIEWENDDAHPAIDAPGGLHLHAFHLESPQPEALRAVLEALDVKATVRKGSAARLVATLDTPRGRVQLTSS